jgi:hypothetical protein
MKIIVRLSNGRHITIKKGLFRKTIHIVGYDLSFKQMRKYINEVYTKGSVYMANPSYTAIGDTRGGVRVGCQEYTREDLALIQSLIS